MNKFGIIATCFILATSAASADQNIISQKVNVGPIIDGIGDDKVWKTVSPIKTRDTVANIDIELRSVHTDKSIFIMARFPDQTENRQHKYLLWNEDLKSYRSGPKREDSFILKWNMEAAPVDLKLKGDDEYLADVWYWKANRTDPVGAADDKMHIYGKNKLKKSKSLISRNGQQFYLTRQSDEGRSAYSSIAYEKFTEQEVPRYASREPEGSRGDIVAKGQWKDGYWTIELSRLLHTGHADDVQFVTSQDYLFGVSRHEIAGKPANPKLEQPLYESGDVGEPLVLKWN